MDWQFPCLTNCRYMWEHLRGMLKSQRLIKMVRIPALGNSKYSLCYQLSDDIDIEMVESIQGAMDLDEDVEMQWVDNLLHQVCQRHQNQNH